LKIRKLALSLSLSLSLLAWSLLVKVNRANS
jgi:hypothetical protein